MSRSIRINTQTRIRHREGACSDRIPRRERVTWESGWWCQDVIIKWAEWKAAVSNVVKEISSSKQPPPSYLSDAPRTQRAAFQPHSGPVQTLMVQLFCNVSECIYMSVCLHTAWGWDGMQKLLCIVGRAWGWAWQRGMQRAICLSSPCIWGCWSHFMEIIWKLRQFECLWQTGVRRFG